MSKDRFLIARCPRCKNYLGMKVGSKSRICPVCGSRVTVKDIVSKEALDAFELKKRIAFLNMKKESNLEKFGQ